MSPPPSLNLHPERERERESRRTHTRTHHDTSARSPSMASTLHSPHGNISVDSLEKPQLASETQHRHHRSRHSHHPSHPTHNASNKAQSRPRSPGAFPSTTTLPSAPSHLPPSLPYGVSSPATFSRLSTILSAEASPIALEFLNFLDDLGILVFCKPLLELCNVDWITLFDDMGIFYLCEPMGAVRKFLKRLGIGRMDREKGGGSSSASKSTWERDTVSWISSIESAIKSNRSSGRGSKRHHSNGGRTKGTEGEGEGEGESARATMKSEKEVDGGAGGIGNGNGSVDGSERVSGASRRRSERAASSVTASGLGQSLRGAPRAKL